MNSEELSASEVVAGCLRALGWRDEVSYCQVLTWGLVKTIGIVRGGRRFVMKLFPSSTCIARLNERLAVLNALVGGGQPVPVVLWSRSVAFGVGHFELRGWLVVADYVPGEPLGRPTTADFAVLGENVGELHGLMRDIQVGPTWAIHACCSLVACDPNPAKPDWNNAPDRGYLHHGDLHTGNIVREGPRFSFFDFDEMAVGTQLDDVASLIGFPTIRSYQPETMALLGGYAKTLSDVSEKDRIYGPELPLALARRFLYLSTIQTDTSQEPRLAALAHSLNDHVTVSGAGIEEWFAAAGGSGAHG